MSLQSIYIENFRSIGDKGSRINLSPVTFLTGCNSAGKSSAAKAILLLNSYLSAVRSNNFNLMETPLDFSNQVKLGSFDSVLNISSREKGIDYIVLGYSWISHSFVGEILVKFMFEKMVDDQLNNGWLKKLSISIDSDEILVVNVADGKYSIDIIDKSKFIECYRNYTVQQIAARVKDYDMDQMEKRHYGHNYWEEGVKFNSELIQFAKTCDVLNLEKQLIESRAINKRLWDYDYNPEIRKMFEETDVIPCKRIKKQFSEITKASSFDIVDHTTKNTTNQGEKFNSIDKYLEDIHYCQDDNEKNIFELIYNPFALEDFISIFIQHLLKSALNPDFCGMMNYVDAATIDVRRLYPLDHSDRFGNLWKEYNDISQTVGYSKAEKNYTKGTFMRKWLNEFGVCKDFKIDNVEGALRISLISEGTTEGRLLADFGYGVTQLIALLLNIEIAIDKVELRPHWFAGMHYMEQPYVFSNRYLLILEEPEVHLHPCLQSKLADMFLDASNQGVRFVVETHSEYMIRRSQVLVAEKRFSGDDLKDKNPFKTYFFPAEKEPYDMGYRSNGHFEEAFGEGFFDEASKASRVLIRLKSR